MKSHTSSATSSSARGSTTAVVRTEPVPVPRDGGRQVLPVAVPHQVGLTEKLLLIATMLSIILGLAVLLVPTQRDCHERGHYEGVLFTSNCTTVPEFDPQGFGYAVNSTTCSYSNQTRTLGFCDYPFAFCERLAVGATTDVILTPGLDNVVCTVRRLVTVRGLKHLFNRCYNYVTHGTYFDVYTPLIYLSKIVYVVIGWLARSAMYLGMSYLSTLFGLVIWLLWAAYVVFVVCRYVALSYFIWVGRYLTTPPADVRTSEAALREVSAFLFRPSMLLAFVSLCALS